MKYLAAFYLLASGCLLTLTSCRNLPKVMPEHYKSELKALARLLEKNYVDAEKGRQMKSFLIAAAKNGRYGYITFLDSFAVEVTRDLQMLSRDSQLMLLVEQGPPIFITPGDQQDLPSPVRNAGFRKVSRMATDIGYVELVTFAPVDSISRRVLVEEMLKLLGARTLVIDLRKNDGGSQEMALLLSSYFFPSDSIIHLSAHYDRPTEMTTNYFTMPKVEGPRLADNPLYLLVGPETASTAEAFCYNLQVLGRATVVGTATAGRSRFTEVFEVGDFGLVTIIPTRKAVNPTTNSDWEEVGVQPDIKVDSSDALRFVLRLLGREQ